MGDIPSALTQASLLLNTKQLQHTLKMDPIEVEDEVWRLLCMANQIQYIPISTPEGLSTIPFYLPNVARRFTNF